MYNWVNKEMLISQVDSILRIDDPIPNAFLTILMESNHDNFEKVNKWISSHQKEYNNDIRKRALIGSDIIKLDALEKDDALSFIEKFPKFKNCIKEIKIE